MTIAKAERFQEDLRQLFKKYGVESGFALFMHDQTMHPIEAHVTRKNQAIVAMLNAMTEAWRNASDIPVWEHWNTDTN